MRGKRGTASPTATAGAIKAKSPEAGVREHVCSLVNCVGSILIEGSSANELLLHQTIPGIRRATVRYPLAINMVLSALRFAFHRAFHRIFGRLILRCFLICANKRKVISLEMIR